MNKKKSSNQKIGQFQTTNDEYESSQFDWSLFQKFSSFMSKQRINFLNSKLSEFYGKNFCIDYSPRYQFSEEWENSQNSYITSNQSENIWKVNPVGIFLSVSIMVLFTVCIWLRNIDYFFSLPGETYKWEPLYIIVMALQLPDGYLRIITKECWPQKSMSLWKIVKIIMPNVYCFSFLMLIILDKDYPNSLGWFFVQIIGSFLMFQRAKNIYQSFRLTSAALNYEYHLKAVDLLTTLLIISHSLAICLYEVTLFETGQTWFSALNLNSHTGITRYLYSVYFGTTTVFTVGYGDITPQNQSEILLLILVQSCGIIIIAYLMNEIGHTLSSMHMGRQNLERELTLMNKMKKYYNMNDQLIHRARSYLIEQKPSTDHMSPDDENKLLLKFNEQLRQEIKSNSSLSVVKSSIFFLCRWSKLMQNSVASKLHNILFSPGELVYQPEGKERIYIIKLGKIDVYSQRKGNKKGNKHVLKTIRSDLSKEVSDNVYGYTAVASRRPVRLYAIAKEYTSGYYLDKQKFIESCNERNIDFQYFHEIKSKIDQSELWEVLQVPELLNSKHHYNPTRMHLFRKYHVRMGSGHNQRNSQHFRNNHQNKMKHSEEGHLTNFVKKLIGNGFDSESESSQIDEKTTLLDNIDFDEPTDTEQRKTRRALTLRCKQSDLNSMEPQCSYHAASISKNVQIGVALLEKINKQIKNQRKYTSASSCSKKNRKVIESIVFDEAKEYSNYFPAKNLANVLSSLDLRQYVYGTANLSKNAASMFSNYITRSTSILRMIRKRISNKSSSLTKQ